MSLLDVFTGGKSDEASDALKRAENYFASIQAPTAAQLTLPELQKYIEAGIVTPAQAQAYLQNTNAFNNENIDQKGTAAQIQALNQLSQVANAGAEGTPVEQAQIENALQKVNTDIGGQRGAIEQAMAARGTPYALIQAALANQTAGQEGQQAHMDAVNAQAAAYQNALNAMSQGGALGGQLQGQQNTQANTVAQAQNAMQQFNAANQQQNSQFNAGNQQSANMANAANRQQVANNNTGLSNARTQYNAQVPQSVFNNEMAKAGGMAGAATNYGNLQQQQGQQNAGIFSGLINAGVSMFNPAAGAASKMSQGGAPNNYSPNVAPNQYASLGYAHGGYISKQPPQKPIEVGSIYGDHDHSVCMAHGGICMAEGGQVPGNSSVAGDSQLNDMIPIQASPGEAVIPRSSVAEHPDMVASLMGDQNPGPQIDFQDVATLLKAMRSIRMGVA